MKRDFDLLRRIMAHIEKLPPNHHTDENYLIEYLDLSGQYEKPVVLEHLWLLKEANLIDATFRMTFDGGIDSSDIRRLTPEGHDFIEAAKDDSIWNKAKETILKPAVSITFSVLLEWLKEESKKKLGLP